VANPRACACHAACVTEIVGAPDAGGDGGAYKNTNSTGLAKIVASELEFRLLVKILGEKLDQVAQLYSGH
jgi:hypothetical protein